MAVRTTKTTRLRTSLHSALRRGEAGFTLIEMLVVMAIFASVATILLFQYYNFNTTIAVRDLAEEIGLTVRQAQTYATSVRSINGGGGTMSDTFPAYGISFSTNTTDPTAYNPTSSSFALFVDTSSSPTDDTRTNNLYDNNGICGNPAVGQECVQTFGITAGDKVISLVTDAVVTSPTVNVVFHRPNPDATICVVNGASCTLASYVKVGLLSPKGIQKTVTIWNTGQISIN
jgi:prepilin-type N-terminal cleavage/methylation domain-containing protein